MYSNCVLRDFGKLQPWISLGSCPRLKLQRKPASLSLPEIYDSFWRAHGHVLSMGVNLLCYVEAVSAIDITPNLTEGHHYERTLSGFGYA
ncbi:hypothetical protein 21 [Diadegma semiclausum ichnovirus]|nr:hypothetical protein 21 [Diadegma semiclausum ichnovirus]